VLRPTQPSTICRKQNEYRIRIGHYGAIQILYYYYYYYLVQAGGQMSSVTNCGVGMLFIFIFNLFLFRTNQICTCVLLLCFAAP